MVSFKPQTNLLPLCFLFCVLLVVSIAHYLQQFFFYHVYCLIHVSSFNRFPLDKKRNLGRSHTRNVGVTIIKKNCFEIHFKNCFFKNIKVVHAHLNKKFQKRMITFCYRSVKYGHLYQSSQNQFDYKWVFCINNFCVFIGKTIANYILLHYAIS